MKKHFTKTLLAVLCTVILISTALTASAQKQDTVIAAKSLVKLNLGALILKNYSFQYERAVGKRISVALGVRFAPKSTLPFKDKFKDLLDDDEVSRQIDNFKTGNFALTPEFRFYVGKKGVFRGFYLAPFARYATYSGEVPYEYTYEDGVDAEGLTIEKTDNIFMSGRINTLSGGLMIGSQWKLSKRLYFDWWILGVSAGSSNGNLKGSATLSSAQQEGLRNDLDELSNDYIKTEATVDANGANVKVDGPWYTIRAGLSLGVRF